jgi:hypothetical protein
MRFRDSRNPAAGAAGFLFNLVVSVNRVQELIKMSWRLRHWPAACALASLLFVTGCGGEEDTGPEFDLVPVTGTVTMDGSPLVGATVTYLPPQGAPPGYYGGAGLTNAEGKYEVTSSGKPGAVAGQYKITISREVGKDGNPIKADPESGVDIEQLRMQGEVQESIPAKFSDASQTTLSATVTEGGPNDHTHTLTSK